MNRLVDKRVLAELERQAGVTLPAVGLITEQAIAGAISTGTHGSGKQSLSHYVVEVRVATYDAVTGEPVIRTINAGPELEAARCSLGCLGIIVSVGLWVRPQYCVEEHFRRYDTLKEVIAAEDVFPLQQFFLIPWKWDYWVQHRREVSSSSNLLSLIYQAYFYVVSDDEDSYSISFNCYARPSELQGFNRFSEVLTRTMASLFEARPHWGKICPIDAASLKSVYPRLAEFQRVSTEFDPDARFRNNWVARLLFAEQSQESVSGAAISNIRLGRPPAVKEIARKAFSPDQGP